MAKQIDNHSHTLVALSPARPSAPLPNFITHALRCAVRSSFRQSRSHVTSSRPITAQHFRVSGRVRLRRDTAGFSGGTGVRGAGDVVGRCCSCLDESVADGRQNIVREYCGKILCENCIGIHLDESYEPGRQNIVWKYCNRILYAGYLFGLVV